MNKGWIIYSEQDAYENKAYINWFIHETKEQNLDLTLILREQLQVGLLQNQPTILVDHSMVELPVFAVVRTPEPLLNLLLEEMGIAVFNSSHVARICNHKALTHFEVSKLQIPMVDTLFMKKINLRTTPPMSFPFVVKEATGRGGKQVFFINNQIQWEDCMNQIQSNDVIIQTTNVQIGKDIRIFVVGKEIVGAVLRESNSDFRANYKLGGTATWFELSSNQINMVHKIMNHFDFGMVGIDFLIDHDGNLLFNEIEDVVGSRTLSAVSDLNILQKYTSYIKSKISGMHS
ncbi:ATP-grasp domain-containing protein [Ornithinibacillus sp. L9]|uniref:ATP-grasp domain-containing protein n=1 Tax=Ornithinibacillus caprae TaxID=2678566 RepID=A0A6N8FFZ6_9BACI|nr:ATP-grasp domain-containing protein [Ornithinibacillus caprae]MUK86967.1 ATP-grasp domain-containing protein [Ornithinibacillus caprae]